MDEQRGCGNCDYGNYGEWESSHCRGCGLYNNWVNWAKRQGTRLPDEKQKAIILQPEDYEVDRGYIILDGMIKVRDCELAPSKGWTPACFNEMCGDCPDQECIWKIKKQRG